MENTEKYIAYFRVSTSKQGHDGLGIEAQKLSISRFGGNVIAEFTEVESGKNNQRVELDKAIKLAQKEDATLLVARLDRLSRNLHFITTLMETRVKFKCVDNPHMDSLTIHIFAAMAQSERERISKNTKNGLNSIKERINKDGYHVSKQGNVITSLGRTDLMGNKDKAKQHCDMMRSKRVYKQQPMYVQELIKSYKSQNLTIEGIRKKLADMDIILSNKCVWSYTR